MASYVAYFLINQLRSALPRAPYCLGMTRGHSKGKENMLHCGSQKRGLVHPEPCTDKRVWDALVVSRFLHWMESAFSLPGHSFLHKRQYLCKRFEGKRFQTLTITEDRKERMLARHLKYAFESI